jgi:hypothetical protein
MHPIYLRILAILVMAVSLFFGIQFSHDGFKNIQEFKQLERIVPSKILGLLEGASQTSGLAYDLSVDGANVNNALIISPKASVPSLYYRFLKEEKETDSDGGTRWVTRQDISRAVDFAIADHEASARVNAEKHVNTIQWSMPLSYQQTQGRWRYTEWRIEPEDFVLIFSWADLKDRESQYPEVSLNFDQAGAYLPIISKGSAEQVRGELGTIAILKIWGGVSLLALSLLALMYTVQIHRVLVYLTLLTVVTTGTLSAYGFAALVADVKGGSSYLAEQSNKTELALVRLLESQGLEWAGWSSIPSENQFEWSALENWQQSRLSNLKLNLNFLQQVYQLHTNKFPENIVAWLYGLDEGEKQFVLSEWESKQAEQRFASFGQTKVQGAAFWWVLLGFLMFVGFTYLGFRFAKLKRMIENVPTSATLGVTYGIAEIKGKVIVSDPVKNEPSAKQLESSNLTGPVTHRNCVWYRYLVEERRGSGKKRRWVTISDETHSVGFYCEDQHGKLAIDPKGAEIITRHKKVESRGGMRYSEWTILPGDSLYAIGQANIDISETDRLIMSDGEQGDIFILSNYSEKELMISKAASSMFGLGMAFSALFFSAVFYHAMNGEFSATDYLMSGLLGPIFLTFIMIVLHYNDLIFLRQRAQRNWANIQVSLKKRSTLLKQLQAVVGGYQQYENTVLTQITAQRKRIKEAGESVGEVGQLLVSEHQLVQSLRLAVEDYPDLKANLLMTQLVDRMTRLENEVALMRSGYNDAVNEYNTRVQSFPDLMLAKAFKFKLMTRLGFE